MSDPADVDAGDLRARSERVHVGTYARIPLVIVRGEGNRLFDADGRSYLDFVSGLAVTSLGHCPEGPVAALKAQADTLWHVSNLYYTIPQTELGEALTRHTFADRCFFANSGAEANEAALKLARKRAHDLGKEDGGEILVVEGGFHGRTFATLSATAQDKVRQGFAPLLPGFRDVPHGDVDAMRAAAGPATAAILVEPILGEGGVVVPPDGYLAALREICDEVDALLILDEVQVGMGRAGAWLASERFGVRPDVTTLAKALGSGMPIGACLATEAAAAHLVPGNHASTFGGNPLACAAAVATIEAMARDDLPGRARALETTVRASLEALAAKHPAITEVRGLGLIWGLQLDRPGAPVVEACQRRGLLVNCAQGTVIRLLPSLVVSEAEIDEGLAILDEALGEALGETAADAAGTAAGAQGATP